MEPYSCDALYCNIAAEVLSYFLSAVEHFVLFNDKVSDRYWRFCWLLADESKAGLDRTLASAAWNLR